MYGGSSLSHEPVPVSVWGIGPNLEVISQEKREAIFWKTRTNIPDQFTVHRPGSRFVDVWRFIVEPRTGSSFSLGHRPQPGSDKSGKREVKFWKREVKFWKREVKFWKREVIFEKLRFTTHLPPIYSAGLAKTRSKLVKTRSNPSKTRTKIPDQFTVHGPGSRVHRFLADGWRVKLEHQIDHSFSLVLLPSSRFIGLWLMYGGSSLSHEPGRDKSGKTRSDILENEN